MKYVRVAIAAFLSSCAGLPGGAEATAQGHTVRGTPLGNGWTDIVIDGDRHVLLEAQAPVSIGTRGPEFTVSVGEMSLLIQWDDQGATWVRFGSGRYSVEAGRRYRAQANGKFHAD